MKGMKHFIQMIMMMNLNPLSDNPTRWSNTLKQFVGNLPTNCFSVFDYFVKLALKGLNKIHAIVVSLQTAVPHLTKFLTKSHRAIYKKKKKKKKVEIEKLQLQGKK